MRLQITHQGVPLGHTDLETEGLAIADFTPGDGYAKVRDVIRAGSKALWELGFFQRARVAADDIASAARLQFELRDDKGALVHSDWVNIIERPQPGSAPMVIARFQQAPAGQPSAARPRSRGDGSASTGGD